MKLLIKRSKKAILPEIGIYKKFFETYGVDVCISENINESDQYDVLWLFMGMQLIKKNDKFTIHEYASLSTGIFAKYKDIIKRLVCCKPNLRVFLNTDVYDKMSFKDNIPYVIRDMAVSPDFYKRDQEKKYDFVYSGAINDDRRLDLILDKFAIREDKSIIVIGTAPKWYHEKYSQYNNITFTGLVDYKKIPYYLNQAKVGINVIDNIYPYNIQTSTKILEYLACGLSIYTIQTNWVDSFSKKNNVTFNYFEINRFDVDADFVMNENYTPLYWDDMLESCGILQAMNVKEM
ncbi:glycosyltransferase [Photobacterium nomapromontoriensis]|uniref:glycosyltransferase n=1 Tax=Photobacterium nomapromontoriensis TaxID=2910237 RepID=UPI003D0E6B31